MNACTMFAWWGFNQWIPAYLSLPPADGGIGLSTRTMSGLHHRDAGRDVVRLRDVRLHQRRASAASGPYVTYLLTAAVLMLAYAVTHAAGRCCSLLGPLVAFFATGYFTGFGAVTAEIYPTEIRATAQGFTYNIGRIGSAVAPWAVGRLAETSGFGAAFSLAAVAFVWRRSCGSGFPKPAAATSPSPAGLVCW